MDLYIGIGVVVLVIAIIGMLATSMLGIKERSYEEALAEQREATNELLGTSQSYQKVNKTKEKKMKKIVKKNKEKLSTDEKSVSAVNKIDSTRSAPPLKHHVEFKEAELIPETLIELSAKKVQSKNNNEKVRPILVHRLDTQNVDMLTTNKPNLVATGKNNVPANHFEQSHPKDDVELFQSQLKEEFKERKLSNANAPIPSSQNSSAPQQKDGKKKEKQMVKVEAPLEKQATIPTKPKPLQPTIEEATPPNSIVNNTATIPPPVKEKKKKHGANGDKQLLQQYNGLANMASLFPLVRNAELSRAEVQTFIDMLLNKQLEAPPVLDEWSEGRADPLQKIKRQLLEREKQLEAEQDAKVSLQQKLVKLREELNSERVQWIQRTKVVEESLQTQQQAALRQKQQIQQLQAQMSEAHKVREDHIVLQQQHKQLEIRAGQVAELNEARVNKLLTDIQEKQSLIGQLRMDVCSVTEQLRHVSDKRQLDLTELNTAGMDLARKDELIRELEQARINMEHQHEVDFNQMQSHLKQQNEDIRRYEFNNDEMQKQRNDTDRLIAQLRADLTQMKDQSLHAAITTSEAHQVEVRNLQNELSSLRGQLNNAVREHRHVIDELEEELKTQKEKNNKNQSKATSANEAICYRKFFERLFPSLQLANESPTDDTVTQAQLAVQTLIDDLDRSKTNEVQLQNKMERLQEAILDSDTMLRNIYLKIQKEEIDWRSKLDEKDAEINNLRQESQIQISELQLELNGEQETHRKTQENLETLQEQVESTGNILQELHHLKNALKQEKMQSTEENLAVVVQNSRNNCSSTNGPALVLEEANGQ